MIRVCSIVLFLFVSFSARAGKIKKQLAGQTGDSIWQKIIFQQHQPPIYTPGSFLIVSNRHILPQQKMFADEACDTTQRHILMVCPVHDTLMVYALPDLLNGIALMPKKNWVLYTEGMGKTFAGNLQRAILMENTYDVNVIMFDYASIDSRLSGRKNYYFSLQNSIRSCTQYTNFLQEIQTIKQQTDRLDNVSINIFLHSMGNLMFRKMMIENRSAIFRHEVFIDNIIFNAACVNRKGHARWIKQIDFARAVYIHYNPADRKLGGAMLISGNRKLGSKPKYPFSKKAHYVNFHQAVGSNHSYFLNIPGRQFVMSEEIKSYYHALLHGKQILSEKIYPPAHPVGNAMK